MGKALLRLGILGFKLAGLGSCNLCPFGQCQLLTLRLWQLGCQTCQQGGAIGRRERTVALQPEPFGGQRAVRVFGPEQGLCVLTKPALLGDLDSD